MYRVSPISYQLLRRLVRVDAIGMVNLIAGERIVPELVQDAFTPEARRRRDRIAADRSGSSGEDARRPRARACAAGRAGREWTRRGRHTRR